MQNKRRVRYIKDFFLTMDQGRPIHGAMPLNDHLPTECRFLIPFLGRFF